MFECYTIVVLTFTCTLHLTSMSFESILFGGEVKQLADSELTRGSDQWRVREHAEESAVCQYLPTTGTRHNRRDEYVNKDPVSHIIPKTFRNVTTDKGLFGIESLSLTCLVFCECRNAIR